MKIWKEFKEFAFKGNVMDLAVGVIIGSAFTAIVTSLVNDLFTPLISLLTGGIDFSTMGVTIGEGENAATFAFGSFIQTIIRFFIIALCVFILVKFINGVKRKPEPAKPQRKCPYCMGVIDELATRCPHCTSKLD